ncbi:HNH endonuclease [Mycobacterium phage LilSpotty]|uniref:HNH endonuclease n=1 Tax=Mycobacterium phage LilSpotty TaxID=2588512 RepID=A0A4Y6EP08_9CAUD|nr:HNH endonuclease [Mycobacterium phage LilSpotty]QDF19815.1 HNH endonuclease [Mycobacterium phage LilSpotty]
MLISRCRTRSLLTTRARKRPEPLAGAFVVPEINKAPATASTAPGCGRLQGVDMADDIPTVAWKSHPEYPHYQASNDGRVRTLDRMEPQGARGMCFLPGRELSLFPIDGYLTFDIKKRKVKVHRFVCEVFNGPPPSPTHEVRHLNGDPRDNRPENLAWGTAKENATDRVRHGRQYRGGKAGRRVSSDSTHCRKGHEYNAANTAYAPDGWRRCRACAADETRRRRARMRERAKAASV